MTAAQDQAQAAVVSQAAVLGAYQEQAQAAAQAYVLSVADDDTWYDTHAVTRLSHELARMTDSYAVGAARSSDRFIADLARLMNLREGLSFKDIGPVTVFRPVGVRGTIGLAGENGSRTGVTTAGVFGRIADKARYQQSLIDKAFIEDVKSGATSPTELASPMDVAVNRAGRAAGDNVTLAARNQSVATMTEAAKSGLITGYRRVLHAELSTQGSCGLCVAASTRTYRVDHLMPMHPGCHCIPMPFSKSMDPGVEINDEDIGRVYSDAGSTSAEALRNTRYKVDEHGELGPVLRPFGKPIRKEDEARRDTNRRAAKSEEQRLRTLINKRDRLQAAVDRTVGEDESWRERLASVSDRIARLNRDIAAAGG